MNMTRRQKRYERRKAKRLAKRAAFFAQYDDFDAICDRKNLFEAADEAKKNVLWKGSVQQWSISQLLKTEQLYRDLKAGRDVRRGFSKFTICERGKVRNISAVKFYERVAQKWICQKVLYPLFTRSLIYDNSASQKGKGVTFAGDRLTTHLRRHYRRYGNEGYALLVDFKNYFGNINHEIVKQNCRKVMKDERLLRLCDDFVDAYGDCGLGLGSETSQVHAIAYPDVIDHAIAEHSGKIFYGRYMDDTYVLAPNKEILNKILDKIKAMCKQMKIVLSPKKTHIVKIKNGVKWLKTRFFLTETGKIIKKPCRASVTRERKKLKRQLKLFACGRLGRRELMQSFESWAGSMNRRNARRTVWNMRLILFRKVTEYEKERNRGKN